jgi:hypothetical protein
LPAFFSGFLSKSNTKDFHRSRRRILVSSNRRIALAGEKQYFGNIYRVAVQVLDVRFFRTFQYLQDLKTSKKKSTPKIQGAFLVINRLAD